MHSFKNQVDALKIILEKHLFDSEEENFSELVQTTVNDFLNYLAKGQHILRIKDSKIMKEELESLAFEQIQSILGSRKNIKEYLGGIENFELKKKEVNEKYFELF